MAKGGDKTLQKVGSWAFIVGVIIAVVAGIVWPSVGAWTAAMVVIGLIVGFLNITDKETSAFLMAAVSLVIIAYTGSGVVLSGAPLIGPWIVGILNYIQAFVTPAAVIVALKAIKDIAKD